MQMRSILLIVTAVFLVGATIFVARGWMEAQRARPVAQAVEKRPAATQVLVAGKDLPVGTFVKQTDLRWQSWPDDNLPESYILKDGVKLEDLEGTVVRRSFSNGQPVTMDRLIKPGERGFLAAVLQAGYRAISIPVSATSGIAGLIFPGDRVDILLTHALTGADAEEGQIVDQARASETILTNVRILALDQLVDDQSEDPKLAKTATLEVLPKQAEVLNVARELGSLSLSLRSLARDQEELDRIARGEEVSEDPAPEAGQTYTWDSEASLLVKDREGKGATGSKISVARGNQIQEIQIKRSN